MENTKYPLVSCICIARTKSKLLEQSINCFIEQTYEQKELLVIYDKENEIVKKTIEPYNGLPQIIFLESSHEVTFQEKINLGTKLANGGYLCFWSGEDWHHIARIEYQYQALVIKQVAACTLSYILLYVEGDVNMYISKMELWAETLFIKRDMFIGQDQELSYSLIINKLDKAKQLYHIQDVPNLYVYTHYFDKKLMLENSWEEILKYSSKLDPEDSLVIHEVLRSGSQGELMKKSITLDSILGNLLFEDDSTIIHDTSKIPKIIHVTYKTKVVPQLYRQTFESIKSMHPNWEIRFYDDREAENIVKSHFPELLEIYRAYPSHIQRVDVFRILLVYLFGGFYLDLDVHCLKSLDELCGSNLVLGEEIRYSSIERKLLNFKFVSEVQVANYMFGSIPGHSFWIKLLMEIINRSDYIIRGEVDVLKSTGPGVLTEVYQKNKHLYKDIQLIANKFKRCHSGCPSVSCHFGDYAAHLHVNGWTWSGKNNENINFPKNSNKIGNKIKEAAYDVMAKRLALLKGLD